MNKLKINIKMLTREEKINIFNSLHDILWNSEGFDPVTSRNTLLTFFSIRLVEDHIDKLKLPKICRYSEMIKLIKEGGDLNSISGQFYEMLVQLRRNNTTSLLFPNVKPLNGDVLRKLFLKIDEFSDEDLHSSDILGELYEVVGSGDKANSEIGQYFTSRSICKMVANVCISSKKSLYKRINGEKIFKSFLDPFCGTGGFTREFINRVNELDNIDWEEWKKNIYSFDRNKSMISIVILNLLFITGKIFTQEEVENITSLDSFRDNISLGEKAIFPVMKYDFIFTNPPFGGDSKKDSAFTYLSTSGKGKDKKNDYKVNEDIQTIGIVDNDKVSAAVQLCMALLAPKGLCAVVLPQGFFFGSGKAKVELRKKLIEEYKVHMVIDIPQDAFLGTTTKTSVLIFQKGKTTDQITFMNMKEEISAVADIEDLRDRNYSLDSKMYIEREEVVDIEGFEMMRLGDLIQRISNRENHSAKDHIESAIYPLISSNINEIFRLDTYDYDEEALIINSSNARGKAVIHYFDKFSVTKDTVVFKSKSELLSNVYLYYFLKKNIYLIEETFKGTSHKHPTWKNVEDIKIPVPSIERQNEIVEILSGWDEAIQAKKKEIETFESLIIKTIKLMTVGREYIELSEILLNLPKTKRLAGDGLLEGEYPFLVSSMIKKRYFNEYDYEDQKLIIGGGGNPNIHLEEKFAASGDMLIFEIKNENFLLPYVYYYLLGNMEILNDHYRGTTIKHINIKNFLEIKIPNLPLEKQMILSISFEAVRNGKREVKELQKVFNSFIAELIPKV